MKYLLPFVLLLTGCFHATWPPPSPIENPLPPPVIIAKGTNGEVSWNCRVSEHNDALTMVECQFDKETKHDVAIPACIKVGFFDEVDNKLVVESRQVCSGILIGQENSLGYVAFNKEKRLTLRRCGELLDLCTMLAYKSDGK